MKLFHKRNEKEK